LKQQILSKNKNDNSDLENDFSDDDVNKDNWGKKKTYWNGDTADLEIGQAMEDAEEEEAAAKVLIKFYFYLIYKVAYSF
jgi:hypothetical protein